MRQYDVDMRRAMADTLIELANEGCPVFWLDADLVASSGMGKFQKAFPHKIINCGIQEANMLGVASGLSEEGLIPFVHSFGAFASRRIADQIFVSGVYAGQNIRIIGSDPGISAGPNGGTHCSLEDIGILRAMPKTVILEPCDPIQLKALLRESVMTKGIFYFRLMRKTKDQFYDNDAKFKIGKSSLFRDGQDAAIITAGNICLKEAVKAADELRSSGINVRIIDMFTIKPLDVEAVLKAARETKAIVTLENHNIMNGLGSAVAEVLAESRVAIPFARLGAPDCVGEVGTPAYLLEKFQMDAQAIVAWVKSL
ncbi:MAG: transketolase family protein [Fusobacteriaceae bacterium]|nr:transketolase family protein [Fusobacteriaceae bacterium]